MNQVTTQAVQITLVRGKLTSLVSDMVSFDRNILSPIQNTTRDPIPSMASSIQTDSLMRAPIPKKQAIDRVISKKAMMKAVASILLRFWVKAVFIAKMFCAPIGMTYAKPSMRPWNKIFIKGCTSYIKRT